MSLIRITGGDKKGNLLKSTSEIRPLTSVLRTSLFDILAERITGSNLIDFFAGAGTFGIEALSRGASFCVFVESNRSCIRTIKENLERTRFKDRAFVLPCDVFKSLPKLKTIQKNFSLSFFDPPYKLLINPQSLKRFSILLGNLLEYDIINKDCLLIIKHAKYVELRVYGFELFRTKVYGETHVSFLKVL